MTKLDKRCRMTIATLKEKGMPNTAIARILEVTEGAVRYHADRGADGVVDGRSLQPQKATGWSEVISAWMARDNSPTWWLCTTSWCESTATGAACGRCSGT